ncbi:pyridoxal kinase [Kiloniella litopenaei]|uniref:pyridoxal kinase n=1 Tax=Kiloniella litopenaei TaxID=1549748 RepID=UPI0006986E1B|nr:pyridoxal kinase [Kiloniella litopenaei]
MPSIISAQSHVCYGHVGNSAAAFPMQKLGVSVHSVPTTILSNHPAHSSFYGQAVECELLQDLFFGLEERGAFHGSAGFQSGYLATQDNGNVIEKAVKRFKICNPQGIYCLDPVMGDVGKGFFVQAGIPELIAQNLLPLADIITPNKFEFDYLAATSCQRPVCQSHGDMVATARKLMDDFALRCVVITSADFGNEDTTHTLVVRPNDAMLFSTPFIQNGPSGTGDLFTGMLMARILLGQDEIDAAELSLNAVYSIIKHTVVSGLKELDIITHQNCIIDVGDEITRNKV